MTYTRYNYSSKKNHRPAPYVTLELSPPRNPIFSNRQCHCSGLLDTGASKTLVPKDYLEELELQPIGEAEEICGIGGSAFYYPYIVSMIIDTICLEDRIVLGWEELNALVGRDILDSLHICFDRRTFYFP